MAKQISPLLKLRGTIDGLTFYKTKDGYLAREKGGIDPDRIRTDPKFDRTRKNALEFEAGARAAKVFRTAFKTELGKAADSRVAQRLTRLMIDVLHTDSVNNLGDRRVELGDFNLLQGFEFNQGVPLGLVYQVQVTPTINRVTGQVTVSIPELTPKADIIVPSGDTHYRVFAAAATVDFEQGIVNAVSETAAILAWSDVPTPPSTLDITLPPNSTQPIFLVMGIEFMKLVNGFVNPSSEGQSALKLISFNLPA